MDFQINDRFSDPITTESNYADVFVDGPDCLSVILEEIKKAKHYIHIQVMLFYSDNVGIKISQALSDKSKEGVTVRVMSDSDMSNISRLVELKRSSGESEFKEVSEMFQASGIKFISSAKESYSDSDWSDLRKELKNKGVDEEFLVLQDLVQKNVTLNLNVVDHRKLIVIDGTTAIVTSMNIGDMYLYDHVPAVKNVHKSHWHDGVLLLKGLCVSVLNKHFASKWMVRGEIFLTIKYTIGIRKFMGRQAVSYIFRFPGTKPITSGIIFFKRSMNVPVDLLFKILI